MVNRVGALIDHRFSLKPTSKEICHEENDPKRCYRNLAAGRRRLCTGRHLHTQLADYAFPGTQFTVDADANTYFNTNYGITISNAYLYKDSRDTFDGIGIANGTVAAIGTQQAGRIDFSEKTDYVTFDYLAIYATTYHAYATDNTEVASFSAAPGTGTQTLTAGSKLIAYLTFDSTGGYGTVSSLTYNFDGKTDGTNNGLPAVPEPESYALLLAGLATAALVARRRKA